jgi:hypothetical protein
MTISNTLRRWKARQVRAHSNQGQKVTVYCALKLLPHVQRAVPLDSSYAYAYAFGQLFSVGQISDQRVFRGAGRDALKYA